MNISNYLSSIESLKDKTVILTGAAGGIGNELVSHLLYKEVSTLVLLDIDYTTLEKIKSKYSKEYPDRVIDIYGYDQASYKSIEEISDLILKKYPHFDYFMFNAGILCPKKRTNKEKYPLTIAINYLGVRHFLEYLTPKAKGKHRYIIAGSIAAGIKTNKNVDIYSSKLSGMTQYNVSKACLEAYVHNLAINNKNENAEYIITEPGISSTKIIRNLPLVIRFLGKYFLKVFFHHPRIACLGLLLATSSNIHNGDYIVPRGLFTFSGYPKKKRFPDKRIKSFLLDK